MKWLIWYCVLILCPLTFGVPTFNEPTQMDHPRGCIYVMGKCLTECEEGTHAYATGCSQKIPEATCAQPNPVKEDVVICDYSACYCDPPTVRDPQTHQCVRLQDCSIREVLE